MKSSLKPLLVWILLLYPCLIFSNPIPTKAVLPENQEEIPAQPQGGVNQLLQFINNNLRLPLSAKRDKIHGQVILEAIIEESGSVSNIQVIKSLNTDCDKEAIRVFSLFKAWRPAQVKGQFVNQKVVIPIDFNKEQSYVDYEPASVITYYDAQIQKSVSRSDAYYFGIMPIDSRELPTGDLQFFKIGDPSKIILTYKFESFISTREPNYGGITADTLKQCKVICFRNKRGKIEGNLYKFYEDGTLFEQETYVNGRIVGTSKKYYPNGMLGEEKIFAENSATDFEYFRWHPNGQMAEISSNSLDADDNFKMGYTLYNLWDAKGNLLVKEGNGEAVLAKYSPSRDIMVEQGNITQGLKNGLWEGFINDKLAIQENFNLGTIATAGYIDEFGRLKEYKKRLTTPEYKKGDNQIANFIIQKLKSDVDIQEKIRLTFTVEKDGSLNNIAIESSKNNSFFEQDIINIFKQTNGNWKPATYLGKPISAKHQLMLNISFK